MDGRARREHGAWRRDERRSQRAGGGQHSRLAGREVQVDLREMTRELRRESMRILYGETSDGLWHSETRE